MATHVITRCQMNLDRFIKDFNILKKKSWEISAENRKLINAEAKESVTNGLTKEYPLTSSEKGPSSPMQGSDKQKKSLLNYTIQEYEEWSSRQLDKNGKTGSGDMKDLAKKTYDKELKKLHKTITIRDKHPNGGRIQKLDRNSKTGKLIIKDNDELVQRLAKDTVNTASERYEDRRKRIEKANIQNFSSGGGYINEKNKQFNEKLDRRMSQSP